jgi:KipI family sensor histidine kinase inhibitor
VTPRVVQFGDSALMAVLGDNFDESLARWARAIADAWDLGPSVPAYSSVVVSFDGERVAADDAEARLRDLIARGAPAPADLWDARLVEIPTSYNGPDLAAVAERSQMSIGELIEAHSRREYTAIFLGFLPGFAYCGRLDDRIRAPRLPRPRERVPAGAVAVADGQTGVYPFPSPGGWNLIGTTDAVMFDPRREQPSLLRAGDRVRFVPR